MAPLRLLAALLAAHLQMSFGQKINEGNNLIAVASHKLAAIKQQSQKRNVTDTDQVSDFENNLDHNLHLKTDIDLQQVNLNASTLYSVGGTKSIKFVNNPAYDGAIASYSINSSKDSPNPVYMTYDTTNDAQLNISANQAVIQQTENQLGFVGGSPLFISFAPQRSGAVFSQSPYIISSLPTQSSLSNRATIQHSPAPQQPSNVQTPTLSNSNMRLRFVPAQSSVPIQSTGPAQSALPIQNVVPIQNGVPIQSTIPIQTTVPTQSTLPIQSTVPIQNTVPIQSTVPIQNTVPIQSTVPIQNTVPIQSTVPIQNTVPIQSTVPMQHTVMMQRTAPIQSTAPIQNSDNMIQNPTLSLFLTHLSQNPLKQDYSAPTHIRYTSNQDQQQPSKQTVVKTLLPLLLQILAEKNNNCYEYKNKKDLSCMYKVNKQGNKKAYDNFDADFGMLSDTPHNLRRIHENKRLNKPSDRTSEEEDYSDENTDYSAEEYEDED